MSFSKDLHRLLSRQILLFFKCWTQNLSHVSPIQIVFREATYIHQVTQHGECTHVRFTSTPVHKFRHSIVPAHGLLPLTPIQNFYPPSHQVAKQQQMKEKLLDGKREEL